MQVNKLIKPRKRRLITIEQLQYILLILTAFILIGLGKLIRARFDWSIFMDSEVWTNTLTSMTAHICIIFGGHKWKIYNEKRSNPDILNRKAIIDQFVLSNDRKPDFYPFIRELDRKNKKRAWITYIQYKIDRLEWKGKFKKAEHLKKYLDEKYIDERIDALRVRYQPIKTKMIFNNAKPTEIDEGFINGVKFIWEYLTPKILIMIGSVIFSNAIVPVYQHPSIETIFVFIYESLLLLLSFIWGTSLASEYVEKVIIANLDYATYIIKLYLEHKKEVRTWQNTEIGEHLKTNTTKLIATP